LRFGENQLYTSLSNFATWKKEQVDTSAFSEWSTVMLVKAISTPSVTIKNDESVKTEVILSEKTEATSVPLIIGCVEISPSDKELISYCKFDLYSDNEVNENNLLETTGWIEHSATDNKSGQGFDTHRFKTIMGNNKTYTIVYSIQTNNGYEQSSEPYTFTVNKTYISSDETI
jgi:hypothetical protein